PAARPSPPAGGSTSVRTRPPPTPHLLRSNARWAGALDCPRPDRDPGIPTKHLSTWAPARYARAWGAGEGIWLHAWCAWCWPTARRVEPPSSTSRDACREGLLGCTPISSVSTWRSDAARSHGPCGPQDRWTPARCETTSQAWKVTTPRARARGEARPSTRKRRTSRWLPDDYRSMDDSPMSDQR